LNRTVLLSLGKFSDRFSFRHQQEDRDYHDGFGHRFRGRERTFYNRHAQHPASETYGFNTKGQQTHTEAYLNGDVDTDSRWQERQMRGRAHACSERFNRSVSFPNNWQEQNGYNGNYATRGSRFNCSQQLAKTVSPDHSDYESDPWLSPGTSTESAQFSPSVCSNSSVASSTVVPSSPNAHGGWCCFDE